MPEIDYRHLVDKYRVTRTDGGHEPGRKHEACRYFVLDLDHDPSAIPALLAYAEACAATRPVLAGYRLKIVSNRLRLDDNPEELL